MDQTQFWQLIERARQESERDQGDQVELLKKYLQALPLEEIELFERIYCAYYHRSYSKWLWKAINDLVGFVSDDNFDYFRAWLISCGERVFSEVARHPIQVREFVDPRGEWTLEEINYAAHDVYEERTGRNLWQVLKGREDYPLIGYDWLEPVAVDKGFFDG